MSARPIRVAIDCMGGDFAPHEIVKGAIQGARIHGVGVQLVGQLDKIKAELKNLDTTGVQYELVEANEVIEMGDSPATAIRKKKNSSIVEACRCVARGESQGVVAAGNTGAAMAAALFYIGRIEGIERPAIGVMMPSSHVTPTLCLDLGANADCIPEMLLQFARMGSIFMESVIGITHPRVGLMNIGEESSKGNTLALSTYKLLQQHEELNFVGNVEGRHLFDGTVDVAVCDGFTGNIMLKTAEGIGKMMLTTIKQQIGKSLRARAAGLLMKSTFKKVKQKVSDEDYGGAFLLGVKGICVIGHGSSNALAVQNAIRVTKEGVERNVIGKIQEQVQSLEGVV